MDKNFLLSRLSSMSQEEFEKVKGTEEFKALNSDLSVRKQFMTAMAKRRSDARKREKLLETLYKYPDILGWISDIQSYRDLRIEQAWISMAITNGENDRDTKASFESLDRRRRTVHNKALAAFCRLVMKSSPGSNRTNTPVLEGTSIGVRDESDGDLYAGELMIPYEEPDNYGPHVVRDEMTTGMFQFLQLIEKTPSGDWYIVKQKVLEKLGIPSDKKLPDIVEVQNGLNRTIRAYDMSDSPDRDDFDVDLFEDVKKQKRRRDIFGVDI